MSSNLIWRPMSVEGDDIDVAKFALRKLYGNPVKVTLTGADVDKLLAFKAGLEDAEIIAVVDMLLDKIERHDTIIVEEVW